MRGAWRRMTPAHPSHSDERMAADIKKDRECAASAYDAGPPSAGGNTTASDHRKCQAKSVDMRAILSVSDKTGLVDSGPRPGRPSASSSCRPAAPLKRLQAAGLPVISVSDVTGFPEMMDGRVKTLHPAVHARHPRPPASPRRPRRRSTARASARRYRRREPLSVCARRPANPETPFDDLVEEIDIGGPSLLRAAAKNFRDVLVVVDPADYPRLLEELARDGGPSLEFRFELMRKAFAAHRAVRRHDRDDACRRSMRQAGR